jgi:UDP-N-acetylglucosamine acyltransferase
MTTIHPTAIVDARAELGQDVQIGAYAIVKGHVTVGAATWIAEHAHVHGRTIIGQGCRIGPGAFVGLDPQSLAYDGQETELHIGDGTIIREAASLHRSMRAGAEHATRVGSHCFIMVNGHVAHDCMVGDHVIMANNVALGGHVQVGNRAFMGGGAVVHQFCRVGRLAIVGGGETVTRDVPPFAAVRYFGLKGYNAVGCRRAGLSRQSIAAIRAAYQCFHTHRTMPDVIKAIRQGAPSTPEVEEFVAFLTAPTRRGIHPSVHFIRGGAPTATAETDMD